MKASLYAVLDTIAEAFKAPFVQPNDNMAIRLFNNAANDPQSDIYQNPEDYRLYKIGTFDDVSGKVEAEEVPAFLANAQLNLKLGDKNAKNPPSG